MGRSDRPRRNARTPDMDVTPASSRQLGRVPQSEQELSSVMPPLAALRPAAAAARAHVRATLAMWGISHLSEDAETIVSEFVANAVNASTDEYGQPVYREGQILLLWVRLRTDGTNLLAEVWDQAEGAPTRKTADLSAESGRGLTMVGELSDMWGWYPTERQPGKCVWAKLRIAP
jgi:anti-sigma regulatory factor (Ser/Thr protein kinase)